MNKPIAAIVAGSALVLSGFLVTATGEAATAGGYGSTTTTKVTYPTTTTKVTYPTTTSSVKPTTTTHVTYPTTTTTMHGTTTSSMKPTTTTTMHETTTTKESTTTTTEKATTTTSSTMATTTTTAANMTLLTLRATVINTHGGTATADDFDLEAAGPIDISGITGAPAVTLASVPPGGYTLRDRVLVAAALGYTSSGWSCIGSADQTPSSVVLDAGEDAVCAIVFADAAAAPGTLTVRKVLQGNAVGQQGAIDIATTCDGVALTPDLIIDAGFTPATSISRAYTGLAAGAVCTSTETADGAAVGITVTTAGSPATMTIVSAGTVVNNITDTINTAEATTTTTAAGATTTLPGAATTVPGSATTMPGSTATTAVVLQPTAEESGTPAVIETTPATTSTLPFTGYDPSRMLDAAGAALILGGAAVAVSKRRKGANRARK